MNETGLERKQKGVLRERGQYALVFGIIALMLYVAGFPLFLLFFVGVLTYFIWKVFASEGRGDTRRIFEFYLLANEMLRDDDRRWYGFEIRDVIGRGEAVVASMPAAPPLVHFALGALYQKLGDHAAAATHLARVVEGERDESAVDEADRQLRDYVAMLRRIERSPAESPQTSAAIRSLERTRRNRAAAMLDESRKQLESEPQQLAERKLESVVDIVQYRHADEKAAGPAQHDADAVSPQLQPTRGVKRRRTHAATPTPDRQTISEVLHDIYDKNA